MMMAGSLHPPFSLLRKERMRRARWKRENGGAQDVPPFFTHVFGPRRGAGGGFGGRCMDCPVLLAAANAALCRVRTPVRVASPGLALLLIGGPRLLWRLSSEPLLCSKKKSTAKRCSILLWGPRRNPAERFRWGGEEKARPAYEKSPKAFFIALGLFLSWSRVRESNSPPSFCLVLKVAEYR